MGAISKIPLIDRNHQLSIPKLVHSIITRTNSDELRKYFFIKISTKNVLSLNTPNLQYFVLTTVPKQFVSSWKIEMERSNSFLFHQAGLFLLIELATLGGLYYLFDLNLVWAFLGQCAVSVYLLEYVNYIRHWGLRREVKDKVTSQISWQSNARLSRYVLVELTRHSDHHLFANRPYQSLRSYDDAPNLPSGYFACFFLAQIPMIWRIVMSKRLPSTTNS